MKDTRQLIKDLNWNNSDEMQQTAIKELSDLDGEDIILMAKQSNDLCSKPCWHNAALVLKNIGYPRNKVALPYLMEWFQDLNWPGVVTIIELLKEIDLKVLLPYIEKASSKAIQEKDECWAFGLIHLIKELKIVKNDFDNPMILELLDDLTNI